MDNLKRREFIKNTVLAGIGTSMAVPVISGDREKSHVNTETYPDKSSGFNKKKVIVAGAGIAGLCCGYELMKRGHEVIVLEASGRHGGHVYTGRDGLSDGLYADLGAEHYTKPGYDLIFGYAKEFDLTVLPYPRRINMLRRIDGKFYSEEMLHDPIVLKKFGFNDREIKYLSENPWWDLQSLFLKPYFHKFKDEYQPFGIGYDHLDNIPVSDIYKKEGASQTALGFLGGKNNSALFELWRGAIMNIRGIPLSSQDTFRLKGGNQGLPDAFAKRLGKRVKLNCPIQSIKHTEKDVSVTYKEFGEEKVITADFLANCIPLPAFKNIPIHPALPPEKQYVIDNVTYGSYPHFVFQASSEFWLDDGFKSINMILDHPDIDSIWRVADEVDTFRVVLLATGPGGVSAQRALAGFREVYPGKHDTIEQALVKDWSKEQYSFTCERLPFPMGELKRFWPEVMLPHRRIYFAGAYADNLNRGQEAATRSAYRVAKDINDHA